MSSTLVFRRTPTVDKKIAAVGYPLKRIFGHRYYDHDGSGGGDTLILNREDMAFLEGVRLSLSDTKDSSVVQKIIDIINNGGTVDMNFEF